VMLVGVLFFISSSRRHTRFSRDWSSDVCSSDLRHFVPGEGLAKGLSHHSAGIPDCLNRLSVRQRFTLLGTVANGVNIGNICLQVLIYENATIYFQSGVL